MSAFGRFLYPGPTEVRPEILAAMAQPMLPHRGPAFTALYTRLHENLRQVFRTTRPVYSVSASATALMEMAIRGAPEGPILSLVNGAFSERFAAIAQQCGRRVRRVTVPWGVVHPLDLVEQHLAGEPWAALTVVHSETSSGALSDLRAITELAHRYGVMCLADAVTSVAACPVETDAWGVDFVLAGSQKALARVMFDSDLPMPEAGARTVTIQVTDDADTASDAVLYYDLEALPSALAAAFDEAHAALEQARRENARERCRRYDDAPLAEGAR